MINFFLILAFLCDITQYKGYISPIFDIECVYIVYFAILFRVKSTPSMLLAFIFVGVASFINGNSVGIDLLLFLTGALCYLALIVYPRRKALGTMYSKTVSTRPQSIVVFCVIYTVSVLVQNIMIAILQYDTEILYILLSYIVNILLFSIVILCT